MPWAVLIPVAAGLAVGFGLGWPLGPIVAAGCLLLPFAIVLAMMRLMPPRVWKDPQARQVLRVTAIRLAETPVAPAVRQALPGEEGK